MIRHFFQAFGQYIYDDRVEYVKTLELLYEIACAELRTTTRKLKLAERERRKSYDASKLAQDAIVQYIRSSLKDPSKWESVVIELKPFNAASLSILDCKTSYSWWHQRFSIREIVGKCRHKAAVWPVTSDPTLGE